MSLLATPSADGRVLRVDAAQHREEIARFTRFVVRGPGPTDCWLWTGVIADDGYGRFSLNRNGDKRVVRPHRYAIALNRHLVLAEHNIVMHEVCDLPLCVRAEAIGGHLEVGTQAQNLGPRAGPAAVVAADSPTARTASTAPNAPPDPANSATPSATAGTPPRYRKR